VGLLSAIKSLYMVFGGAKTPVSVGLRRAGDPTPYIVYEITQMDIDISMPSKLAGHYTMQITAECVANTAMEAWDAADDLLAQFSGNVVDNVNDITLVLVTVGATARTDAPDDGQSDAERIVTLVITILAKDI
jgi:hypothetical protein